MRTKGGSAAAGGEVREGDSVLKIDRQDVGKCSVEEIERMLVGEPGSNVCITLQREGMAFETRDVFLVRAGTDLYKSIDVIEGRTSQSVETAKSLYQQLADLKAEILRLLESIGALESQQEASKQIEILLRSTLEREKNQWNDEKKALEEKCRLKDVLSSKLQSDLSIASSQLSDRDKELYDLRIRLDAALHEKAMLVESMQNEIARLSEKLAASTKACAERDEEIKKLLEQLNAAKTLVTSKDQEIKDLNAVVAALKHQLDGATKTIFKLKEEQQNLQSALDGAKRLEETLRETIARDEARFAEILQIRTQECKQKDYEIQELKEALERLKALSTRLEHENGELKIQLEAAKLATKAKERELSEALENHAEVCAEMKGKIETLQKELDEARRLLRRREDEIAGLDQQIDDLKQELAALRNQLNDEKARGDLLQQQIDALLAKHAEECRKKDAEISALKDEIKRLKELLAQRDDELLKLKAQLGKCRCAEKDEKIEALLAELEEMRRLLAELRAELAAAKQRCAELEKALKNYTCLSCAEKDRRLQELQEKLDEALRAAARREIVPKPKPEPKAPEMVGVGIRMTDEPPHRVVELVPGGPAAVCGQIAIGDRLMSVAGIDIGSMPMNNIKKLIVGPAGSNLVMGFIRESAGSDAVEFRVSMTRGLPPAPASAAASSQPAKPASGKPAGGSGGEGSSWGMSDVFGSMGLKR